MFFYVIPLPRVDNPFSREDRENSSQKADIGIVQYDLDAKLA